jgi:hypothetical protein
LAAAAPARPWHRAATVAQGLHLVLVLVEAEVVVAIGRGVLLVRLHVTAVV